MFDNKKPKVVFNWIGPNGPLPNLDSPSLAQLAHVHPNTEIHSSSFLTEYVWERMLTPEYFDMTPRCNLKFMNTKEEVIIYPYSLHWKIPVTNYFLVGSGILESSFIDEDILHYVRYEHGYILLEYNAESYIDGQVLNAIHNYFNSLRIPLNKVIYMLGCENADEIYDKWLINNNISSDIKIKIVNYSYASDGLAMHAIYNPNAVTPIYDCNHVPSKTFLSYNRRYRYHRIALALHLDKLGVLDKCYYSLTENEPENKMHISEYINNDIIGNNKMQHIINSDDINNFLQKAGNLVIDNETNGHIMTADDYPTNNKFYHDSLVSLVTETTYDVEQIQLSEKSFKPIRAKHPFIIVGSKGSVKALQKIGYKTFSEFWDETYDTIEDNDLRLEMIAELCHNISQWDKDKVLEFKRNVAPILEHNFQIFMSLSKHRISKYVSNMLINEANMGSI